MALGTVPDEADRQRPPARFRVKRHLERFVELVDDAIAVSVGDAPLDPGFVNLDIEAHALVHLDRERLRTSHAAHAAREDEPAFQGAAEVLPRARREGLVGALDNSLGPDVRPPTRGHLTVHREAVVLEHPQDRLLPPPFAPERRPAGRLDSLHAAHDRPWTDLSLSHFYARQHPNDVEKYIPDVGESGSHGDESCRDDCDLDRSIRRGPRSGARGDGGPAWGDADRRPDDVCGRRDRALRPAERASRSRLPVVHRALAYPPQC